MLEYRIYEGKNNLEQNPVIFLIHGYGSNADDLFSFSPYLPKTHSIISLQAPLRLASQSYAWYPLYPKEDGSFESNLELAFKAIGLLIENIDYLTNKYHINTGDISLLGFSQGAILSWALAYGKPKKVRRVIALSGYIHESIETSISPEFVAYASHGLNDPVIPVEKARNSILKLSEKYTGIEYYEFPDGHTVSQENLSNLLTWIEKTNL